VTDSGNDRIQKFSSTGHFITKWGYSGSGNGQFNGPGGVATDSAGSVYVTDYDNNRVQKFDNNGKFLATWGTFQLQFYVKYTLSVYI
jgi:tripartite motif-containing protein 71